MPYLKLFSCCQITRGASRALLMDIQRQSYWLIPLGLCTILEQCQTTEAEAILNACNDSDRQIVNEYFSFLIEHELAFYCDTREEADCFPEMDLTWSMPFAITNAVIEIKNLQTLPGLSRFLEGHYIPCIQFALHQAFCCISELTEILNHLSPIKSKTRQLVLHYQPCLAFPELIKICHQFPDIELLLVHSVPEPLHWTEKGVTIIMSSENINFSSNCGQVSDRHFNLGQEHYTEAQMHNTCLNRKISIDTEGNIRNCPSMKESFGNIHNTSLAEALNKPGFKKYWDITKDQISVCKDCEFRYVCTDCRAYLEQPGDIYSKPLKCGYDPYTCTWEEWSSHPMKQAAMAFYDF